MNQSSGLGAWLKEKCDKEGLSLRQAAEKTGLSHATIAQVIKSNGASPDTIKKLAQAFGGNGVHRLTLEDQLLMLAGYRSEHPDGTEPTETMARVLDRLSQFDERKLKIMSRFADFLCEMED